MVLMMTDFIEYFIDTLYVIISLLISTVLLSNVLNLHAK